jgi:ABC-type transporter Mla subunit MlaD
MSESRNRNVLIGLFVLGAMACLAILIVKFGEAQGLMGKRNQVTAVFGRLVGVREGTQVYLNGVWVGQVSKVDLADRNDPGRGIVVDMEIDKQFMIPRDWVAGVSQPLMGQPLINIQPPKKPLPPRGPDDPLIGLVTGPLDEVLPPELQERLLTTSDQIRNLATALQPVATDLHELLQKRPVTQVEGSTSQPTTDQVTANLSTAVDRLNSILRSVESLLGDQTSQTNFKETLANLRTASDDARLAVADFRRFGQGLQQVQTDARKTIANMNDTVDMTRQRIDTLGKKLEQNSDQLGQALGYFASAGRDLAEGKGTLGMFLRDPKFYEELFLTVERLAAAAQDLQVTVRQWRDAGFPVKLK